MPAPSLSPIRRLRGLTRGRRRYRLGGALGALHVVAVLVSVSACTPATAPLGDLAGKLVSAGIEGAGKPHDRRKDYDYRRHVDEAKWACRAAATPTRLIVPDGEAHFVPKDDAVRFVRFADCKVEWLDACASATKDATYGARTYAGREVRHAETIDVADEIDLYERFPAFSAMFGGRMTKPTTMRVEHRSLTIRETSRTFARTDLEHTDACTGATHWVASVEHGSLRINFDPSGYAGEQELEAQKVHAVGSYAACVREEEGACEGPIAITIVPLRGVLFR